MPREVDQALAPLQANARPKSRGTAQYGPEEQAWARTHGANESERKALVVTGMHRSGTSALARVLSLLGADLPHNLMPPAPDNPEGFWEPVELVRLHDEMMNAAGSSWHDLDSLSALWENADFVALYGNRIIDTIKKHYGQSKLFVVKDPRIARFVPVTVAALRAMHIEPNFLITFRNPLEVAASLKERNGFHFSKSLLLWLDHTLRAERSTRAFPRTFVLYDALLRDWRSTLHKAAADLDLTFPACGSRNDAQVEAFLNRALRHHTYAPEDVHVREDITEWVKATFEAVRSLVQGNPGDHLLRLDDVYDAFATAQTAFAPLLVQEQLLVRSLTKERDASRAEAKERRQEAERLSKELAARDAEANDLASKLQAQQAQARNIEAKLAARDAEANDLASKLQAQQAQARNIEAKLAARELAIQEINNSTSWRITAPLRFVRRAPPLAAAALRRGLSIGVRCIYHLAPLPLSLKMRIKDALFHHAAPLFRHTVAYRDWELWRRVMNPDDKQGPLEWARARPSNKKIDYSEWIARNDTLSDRDQMLIQSHIASFKNKPKISILMPVYNTPPKYLRPALESVLSQLYPEWELCVVDDASTSTKIRPILGEYANKDARIRPCSREENGGISACTNTALQMASGVWIALMDHDDVLSEHALYLVAEAINSYPDAAIIYSDEDHIDAKGRRSNPYFKPDWDYDLFLGQNLINHLGAYRGDLVRQVGGFREGFEGSQDWDFVLRVLDTAPNAKVHHVPFILYHWRQTHGTFSRTLLARAVDAAQRAVNEHFTRTKQAATAIPEGHSSYLRIKRDLPAEHPLVSIVIPTKDQCKLLRTCTDGLLNRSGYKPIEIVIVDNGSSEPDALAFLADIRSHHNIKVVEDPAPFNFSRLVNRGVAASSGHVCVLLNNDIDVITSDWLAEMVSHALRPEVGAVGAKLYYANDTLQHGGVILGLGGVAGHAHRSLPRYSPGYFNRLNSTHNLSCITGACLAIRRDVYDEIGGFKEQHLTVAFNDVDFCIRVRQAGYKVIWTPNAELYHYESLSRGYESTPEKAARFKAEIDYMRKQWGPVLDNDPFYNPNLALDSESFDLAARTRARKPWLEFAASRHSPYEIDSQNQQQSLKIDTPRVSCVELAPYSVKRLRRDKRPEYRKILLIGHSASGKSRIAKLTGADRQTCDFDRYVKIHKGDPKDIFLHFLSSNSCFLVAPNRRDIFHELIQIKKEKELFDDVAIIYLCRPKEVVKENMMRVNEDGRLHQVMSEMEIEKHYAEHDRLYRSVADYVFNYNGSCIDEVMFGFEGLMDELHRNDASFLDPVDKVNLFHEYLRVRSEMQRSNDAPALLNTEQMKDLTAGGYQVFDSSVFPPVPMAGSISQKKLLDLRWKTADFAGMTVAEIGSQLGFFSFIAASLGADQVIGTDVHSKFVTEANRFAAHYRRICGWHHDKVMFRTQRIKVGEPIVAKPDIIVVNAIVHWFIIQQEALSIEDVLCWLHDNCNYAVYFEGCVSASETIMRDNGVSLARYNESSFLEACARVFRKRHIVGRCSYNVERIVVRLYK